MDYTKMTLEQITNRCNELEAEQRATVEAVENAMRDALEDVTRQQATIEQERQRLEKQKAETREKADMLKAKYQRELTQHAESKQTITELQEVERQRREIGLKLDAIATFGKITPAPALVAKVNKAQEAAQEARPRFNDARAEIRQALHRIAQDAETLNEKIGYSAFSDSTYLSERYQRALSGQSENNPDTTTGAAPYMGNMVRTVITDPRNYHQKRRE